MVHFRLWMSIMCQDWCFLQTSAAEIDGINCLSNTSWLFLAVVLNCCDLSFADWKGTKFLYNAVRMCRCSLIAESERLTCADGNVEPLYQWSFSSLLERPVQHDSIIIRLLMFLGCSKHFNKISGQAYHHGVRSGASWGARRPLRPEDARHVKGYHAQENQGQESQEHQD